MKRALELGEWRLRASHDPQPGGHLFDAIVAHPESPRRRVRRRPRGRQRGPGADRNAGRTPGRGGRRRRAGRPRRPTWCAPARPQGADPAAHDGGWRRRNRRCRRAADGTHHAGARPSGDGPLDVGHVPALVHLRPRPPARPGRRDPPGPGVGRRRRPGRAGADDGPRFDGVRGPRPRQGWGGLRLHPPAWLPPGAGQQGRHRRGASPAHAHRLGQHRPRGRTVRGRAGRSGPPGRAAGPLTLRGDSGFWSAKVLGACRRHAIRFSVTVRQTKLVTAAIAAIGEDAWTDIDYPDGGVAQVAETTLAGKAGGRLVVRRTRLVGAQATLWPDWRHHALVTDRAGSAVELVAALGLGSHALVVAKTIRRRFITLPGRLTHSARRRHLHLPSGWPWAEGFLAALARLRALPLQT